MQYRTHLTTSLAISLPIMASTNTLTIGNLLAVSLGSLFPDVDEPHSWIGSRTRGISDLIKAFFGHRGITHSIFGMVVTSLTVLLMITILNLDPLLALFFLIGYFLHLLEDSFSKSGVKWLLPLADNKFQSGGGVFYYITGGMIENIILFGSVIILLLEIRMLDFSAIPLPDVNISQTVSDLIQKATSYIKS